MVLVLHMLPCLDKRKVIPQVSFAHELLWGGAAAFPWHRQDKGLNGVSTLQKQPEQQNSLPGTGRAGGTAGRDPRSRGAPGLGFTLVPPLCAALCPQPCRVTHPHHPTPPPVTSTPPPLVTLAHHPAIPYALCCSQALTDTRALIWGKLSPG